MQHENVFNNNGGRSASSNDRGMCSNCQDRDSYIMYHVNRVFNFL